MLIWMLRASFFSFLMLIYKAPWLYASNADARSRLDVWRSERDEPGRRRLADWEGSRCSPAATRCQWRAGALFGAGEIPKRQSQWAPKNPLIANMARYGRFNRRVSPSCFTSDGLTSVLRFVSPAELNRLPGQRCRLGSCHGRTNP